MDISLIICTRNRAAQLGPCLEAVAGLRFDGSWELVMVDNGSTDATRATIEAFRVRVPFPVRIVHQPVPGLGNARNAGIAAAESALVAFTDDDCYVAPDLLTRVVAAFAQPDLGYVSGRILLHDPSDYPATINESTQPLRFPPGRYLAPGAIRGANLAFRRAALDAIGWFDPLFGSGARFPAEDVDAAGRCSLHGWAGAYDPSITVSHHHGRKARHVRGLFRDYDYGRGAYHAKLLLHDRAAGAALRGWAGLPRRMRARPSTLWWEVAGAARYARCHFGQGSSS
ncbi:glycosyltransferase family 2 protein [Sphingomonas sp. PL-96]|uniref:glycosyltransferase family 2 protein n=1 Tax=Sphingomonas sp. PL-96 TaxID=2887201 RepID=UPI001E358B6D|nr:glycosyltransferase family 2 protein [Sphingomonas sp. PL-96]MCC2975216.1 glycosyltransferase family 2 protein [Sphingomonas sp. PL-96]